MIRRDRRKPPRGGGRATPSGVRFNLTPAAFDAALADDWVVYGTSPSLPMMNMQQYLLSLEGIAAAFENSNYDVEVSMLPEIS